MKIVTTASTQRKRCLFAHILNLCRILSASTHRTYRCAPSRSFVFAACSQCSLFHGPVLPPSPRLVPKLHMCLNRVPRMEPLSMTKPKQQTIISTPLSTNLPLPRRARAPSRSTAPSLLRLDGSDPSGLSGRLPTAPTTGASITPSTGVRPRAFPWPPTLRSSFVMRAPCCPWPCRDATCARGPCALS